MEIVPFFLLSLQLAHAGVSPFYGTEKHQNLLEPISRFGIFDTSLYGKLQLPNGLAQTPQMGWNSWNFFACRINETVVKETADSLIRTGLAALGYTYVNIDDCWAKELRSLTGELVPDPKAFPSGIKALADYVHEQGLKLGIYSDAGIFTCQVRPGSLFHEHSDSKLFASWGVDYLKYDNCYNLGIEPKKRYPLMRDALNSTGHAIFYSLCEWGIDNPALWAGGIGNSWRTTDDITDTWERSKRYEAYTSTRLEKHHMPIVEPLKKSKWHVAPLLIGCDVRNMTAETLEILSNAEVIAVNQDPLGIQGRKVSAEGPQNCRQVWAGPLSRNRLAVAFWNRCSFAYNITAKWEMFGLSASAHVNVRDLWKHQDLQGCMVGLFAREVEPHACEMYIFKPYFALHSSV